MRARKVDSNHGVIAEAFEKLGCLVHHTIGDWDLTVSKYGVIRLVECKRSAKAKSTKRQIELAKQGWPIVRVESVDDVIKLERAMSAGIFPL